MFYYAFLLYISINYYGFSIDAQRFRSDYTYDVDAGGWFKLHKIATTWKNARLRCSLEGAVLASPLNAKINEKMKHLIRSSPNSGFAYTGIHATFSDGDYFSIEGIPLNKIPNEWGMGEPNEIGTNEKCIVLYSHGDIADVHCEDYYSYICYKNDTTAYLTWNEACGTTDLDYRYDAKTGHCYKFHRVPRTWSQGHMACAAEGGYLAIINTEEEADVIRSVFDRNPPNEIIGNFEKAVASIGFHDWSDHGDWKTIHGQTLSQAGYNKFAPGQPDNSSPGQHCGAVFRSGQLDDLWCDNAYNFICEKEPDSLVLINKNMIKD